MPIPHVHVLPLREVKGFPYLWESFFKEEAAAIFLAKFSI